MPEIGPITLPLLLVDQDRFQALLQAVVDIPKLLQLLVMFTSRCSSIHLNAFLASS